ncbi:MAG: glycosyltransferase [Patescibacteria group bacterium]
MNNLSTYRAYKNKITNKLWGVVSMPAQGKKRGDALISYITEPFTLAPWETFSNFHTMYWEVYEIARLLSERGYEVDIIRASDRKFIPRKPYVVCIDSDANLERLIPHLPKDCKKIFPILISHWEAYNEAERKRLDYLEQRRGVRLAPRRKMLPSKNAELADYLEGFGNKAIFGTFKQFQKPIFFIPISSVVKYNFPENKDWKNAKKNFLWIGGGGSVLKGLDLTLEAFAKTPELELHVCGPVHSEKDFVEAYKKELCDIPNIHVYGRIDVGSKQFTDIIDRCSAVVYPSGGEGTSGAIVQAMHAGLVPIITHETGIREDSGYIALENPTPESVAKAVRDFSNLPEKEVENKSRSIWRFARNLYTRENFSKGYGRLFDEIMHL